MYKAIDISKHQGRFDGQTAKVAGLDAIILRHAYAAIPDTLATGWANNVRAAGLHLGGYGFATWHYRSRNGGSVNTARALMRAQVSTWITQAKTTGADWWFAIDQELEAGQTMGLGKCDNTALINEAARMLVVAGMHPLLYCSVSWDMAWISTADLDIDYWLARYYDGSADFSDAGANLNAMPAGTYTNWMRALYDAGRLVGWQYGSTGHGTQYGCGSTNVDRNVFYKAPFIAEVKPEVSAPTTVAYVSIGPATRGDISTITTLLNNLCIGYSLEPVNGLQTINTTIPVSAGDQASIIALATELSIGVHLTDTLSEDTDTPAEQYSVVFVGMAIKGGFVSKADAVDYIETVLGKDAMDRLGMTIRSEE